MAVFAGYSVSVWRNSAVACVQTHHSPHKKSGTTAIHSRLSLRFFFLGEGDVCAQAIRLKFKGEEINASQSVFKLAGEHFIKFISKRTVYLSFPKTAPVKPNGEVLST